MARPVENVQAFIRTALKRMFRDLGNRDGLDDNHIGEIKHSGRRAYPVDPLHAVEAVKQCMEFLLVGMVHAYPWIRSKRQAAQYMREMFEDFIRHYEDSPDADRDMSTELNLKDNEDEAR